MKSIEEKIQSSYDELIHLIGFMVDCEDCPLDMKCHHMICTHGANLCDMFVAGDVLC